MAFDIKCFRKSYCYHYYFDVFKIMLIIKKIRSKMDGPLSSASESSVHNPKIFPYLQMQSFFTYRISLNNGRGDYFYFHTKRGDYLKEGDYSRGVIISNISHRRLCFVSLCQAIREKI